MKNKADKSVNELYGGIRTQYNDARANGYRLHTYFLKEQEIIVSSLNKETGIILDVGCGSGLMGVPLLNQAKLLIGLDFNEQACLTAKYNSLAVIRGDAFNIPFKDRTINNAYCCQFLNQQSSDNMKLLLSECHRILIPGGQMILIWRNGEALIHKVAHAIFKLSDLISDRPSFPMVNHSISEVEDYATSLGFEISKKETIFPLIRWQSHKFDSLLSRVIGASFFLVLKRN
jgi:ubiquinone/menaquinone biosynthesis C-methylase UbiE